MRTGTAMRLLRLAGVMVILAAVAFALFGIHGHAGGCSPQPRAICDATGHDFVLLPRILVIGAGAAVGGILLYAADRMTFRRPDDGTP